MWAPCPSLVAWKLFVIAADRIWAKGSDISHLCLSLEAALHWAWRPRLL